MARSANGLHDRVIVDGHDISGHVAEITAVVRPGGQRTATVVMIEPKVETDPETGAMTFTFDI